MRKAGSSKVGTVGTNNAFAGLEPEVALAGTAGSKCSRTIQHCTAGRAQQPLPAPKNSFKTSKEFPHLLELPIVVGDQSSMALIDSGASHCFVQCNLVLPDCQIAVGPGLQVQLANGAKFGSNQTCMLPINFGCGI